MTFSPSLQFPNNPVALGEWFLFSIAIIVIVTLVYVFVLNKTKPVQGETVSKLEQEKANTVMIRDPDSVLLAASQALQTGDYGGAIEHSVKAVSMSLMELLASSGTSDVSSMSISDMAFLVQTRARSTPQIAQPIYQLNTLRLKVIQRQPVEQQEASWAVSFANWFIHQVKTEQVKI